MARKGGYGRTCGGYHIEVGESYAFTETGAHEQGHTLGAKHSSGLMSENKLTGRTVSFSERSIKEMFKRALAKPKKGEAKCTLINSNSFTEDQLKNIKIMTRKDYERKKNKNEGK